LGYNSDVRGDSDRLSGCLPCQLVLWAVDCPLPRQAGFRRRAHPVSWSPGLGPDRSFTDVSRQKGEPSSLQGRGRPFGFPFDPSTRLRASFAQVGAQDRRGQVRRGHLLGYLGPVHLADLWSVSALGGLGGSHPHALSPADRAHARPKPDARAPALDGGRSLRHEPFGFGERDGPRRGSMAWPCCWGWASCPRDTLLLFPWLR